jgi:hypothetical protein
LAAKSGANDLKHYLNYLKVGVPTIFPAAAAEWWQQQAFHNSR